MILTKLQLQEMEMEKAIIYCRSNNTYGDIYETFAKAVQTSETYAMFHTKTLEGIKDNVLK